MEKTVAARSLPTAKIASDKLYVNTYGPEKKEILLE